MSVCYFAIHFCIPSHVRTYTNNCVDVMFKIWYMTIPLLSVAHMIQIVRLLALLAIPVLSVLLCSYSYTDKKENKILLIYKEIQRNRVQSHLWLTTSSYIMQIFVHSSFIRKPFLIYDFAPDPIWGNFFSFLSVYRGLIECLITWRSAKDCIQEVNSDKWKKWWSWMIGKWKTALLKDVEKRQWSISSLESQTELIKF